MIGNDISILVICEAESEFLNLNRNDENTKPVQI